MKKMLLFMLFFVVLLSGCGSSDDDDLKNPSDPNDETVTYTVTFFDADMNVIKVVDVAEGEDATAPNDPEKIGYTFNEWSDSFEQVSRDLMIYPIFIPNMYSIYYYSDGELIKEVNNLMYQENIEPLYVPSKEGYIFDGWFVQEGFDIRYMGDSMPSNDLILHARWTPESSLSTEELYYYSSSFGNSNGNLQNIGLVAYDYDRDRHLYSVGHSVYAYDSLADETTLVFTSAYAGRPTYLNVYGDYLYYIDSEYGYLMRYDLVNDTLQLISDKEYHFLSRNQSYIYALSYEDYYGEDRFVLRFYSESNGTFNTTAINTVEHINSYGSRIYYTNIDSVSVELRASNFMGRSTIVNLENDGFETIEQLVLQDVTQNYEVYIGFIGSKVEESGFYIYNSVDGVTEVSLSSQIHDLNFDGTYFYYIDGTTLMKVDPTSLEVTELMSVPSDVDFLNIIHHWIYYGDYESGNIYRVHPDTLEVVILSE